MEKEKKHIDIELRSDEYQEIVRQSPRWLVRSGIVLVLGAFVLLLLGSYFFRYPDAINAKIVVLTENPPVYLPARVTARIDSVFVVDRQTVRIDQPIAILENTARYDDAVLLKNYLANIGAFMQSFDTLQAVRPILGLQLGDVQSEYSTFARLYNDYFTFLRLKLHVKQVRALKRQIATNKEYYGMLRNQIKNLETDYQLAYSQFSRDSLLLIKGVLSNLDFEKSKAFLLQKKFNLGGSRTKLAETQADIIRLEQVAVDVENTFAEQNKKAQNTLVEAIDLLKSKLANWEQTYMIKSPIEGTVSFVNFWSKDQQVTKDEVVFMVIPAQQSQIIGRVSLPIKGAGKVAVNQRVNIRFDNFPYMEYGMVRGKVRHISLMHNNENYVVEVELPQDLKTNYGITLPFSQDMSGSAEIITSDLRLIQRFLNPVKSLMKHRFTSSERIMNQETTGDIDF